MDHLASDLIELSTRDNFVYWLAQGLIYRGWARSASGNTAEGIPWIEQALRVFRATGTVLNVPYFLGLKAEALHLADRTSEALEAINEAEALVERFEDRCSLGPVTDFRNVGGDDRRHDGSVRHPHAADLCNGRPQSPHKGKGVCCPVGVSCGLSGIVDGFQPRRHAGAVGVAQPSTDFPHDGRHQPRAR